MLDHSKSGLFQNAFSQPHPQPQQDLESDVVSSCGSCVELCWQQRGCTKKKKVGVEGGGLCVCVGRGMVRIFVVWTPETHFRLSPISTHKKNHPNDFLSQAVCGCASGSGSKWGRMHSSLSLCELCDCALNSPLHSTPNPGASHCWIQKKRRLGRHSITTIIFPPLIPL